MIYINQIGTVELGRGKTLDEAISEANANCRLRPGRDDDAMTRENVRRYRPGWKCTDGEVVWCDEAIEGYND